MRPSMWGHMINMRLLLLLSVMFAGVPIATAGEHAHFAAFFNNGTNSAFAFPPTVQGDQIEKDMSRHGAEMMIFAHSAGIRDGDVWTLQNDTLRDVNGELHDFGLDCKLSLKSKPFHVAGLCSVFMTGSGSEKSRQIIKAIAIKDQVTWYKVFEDKKHGLAGYFMRETAADFNR